MAAAGVSTTNTVSATFPSNVHAGDLLLAFAFLSDISGITCADSDGNVYNLLDVDMECACWWAIAKVSGPLTVTATTLVSTYTMGLGLLEISNVDPLNPIFAHSLSNGSGPVFPSFP